jgi:hypothetical protein
MNMEKAIDTLKAWFAVPSAKALALRELEDAQRRLLQAQSGAEYAKNMATYHEQRIKRLSVYLKDVLPKDDE